MQLIIFMMLRLFVDVFCGCRERVMMIRRMRQSWFIIVSRL